MLSNIYKPFTPKLSASVLRSMVKEYKTQVRHGRPKWRNVKPGMVMFFRYDAKHKEYTYDKYPITLIFWKKGNYMLGLNFHWVEAHARIRLIQAIIKVNTHNGKINYPLKFDYRKLLPHLKGKAFSKCVRLYIRSKIRSVGVIVQPDNLMDVARLRLAQFVRPK
jgi:hypothetical protein